MIDWVTCKLYYPHKPIQSGWVQFITPDGELDKEVTRLLPVEGSHASRVAIRSQGASDEGMAEYLVFSGNPSKFLQGHNIFGSCDLLALMSETFEKVFQVLGIDLDQHTEQRIKAGDYLVSRVDYNRSYTLQDQHSVMSWLHAAQFKSRSRAGRPASYPGTVYWQKSSRRWSVKAYSKFNEITKGGKRHRLSELLCSDSQALLLDWCTDVLRVELVLKAKEIDELELKRACDLAPRIDGLYEDYVSRIIMNGQQKLSPAQIMKLPARLRSTYALWKDGHFMIDMLSRASYYRHRKELLEFGVDISMPCDADTEASNVVPLIRVLEAKPKTLPTWAHDLDLIHKSA